MALKCHPQLADLVPRRKRHLRFIISFRNDVDGFLKTFEPSCHLCGDSQAENHAQQHGRMPDAPQHVQAFHFGGKKSVINLAVSNNCGPNVTKCRVITSAGRWLQPSWGRSCAKGACSRVPRTRTARMHGVQKSFLS
jgi:hypothetical protein